MKRFWFPLLLALAPLAAAQSLEFGLWAGGPGFSIGPTVNLNYPTGDWTLDAYLRAWLPNTDEISFGLGAKRAFEAGPAGRGEVGARGFIGMDAHYWLEGFGSLVLGKAALDLRTGYTYNRTPSHFWPLQGETLGPYARLDGKFRLDRRLTLRASGAFHRGGGRAEAALAWRVKRSTFTLGAGGVVRASNAYALLGYKTPVENAVVDAELRLGAWNELRLRYAEPAFKARIALGYPFYARIGATWDAWDADAEVDDGGYEFYLRYTLPLEGL
ncbi:MAG TPA: hypothetical protein ENK37_04150 [Oceanithermus profundus]|uniref:Cellulose biosynthesis protein BcsS n=1 Tax=Oceanithermus profundus TaxID=187137 RepID=A0A7C4Z4U2_9DEIN|nr:hypothetical protein [Oceanithermus profundus]